MRFLSRPLVSYRPTTPCNARVTTPKLLSSQKRLAAPSGTSLGRPRVACATTQIYEKVRCDGLRTMRRFLHMEDENARPIGFFCAETELRTAKLNEAPKKSHLDTAKSPHSPLYWRERRASRAQVHKNFLKILLSQPVHPVEFSKNIAPWRKFEK